MARIAPGTDVTWASQAQGSWSVKRGVVLGYVEPGADGRALIPPTWREHRSRIKFQARSKVPRYVVVVHDRHGRPDYYAPHAAALERQTQRIQTI